MYSDPRGLMLKAVQEKTQAAYEAGAKLVPLDYQGPVPAFLQVLDAQRHAAAKRWLQWYHNN